ncbi:hypothetical protein J3D46_002844 [Paenarthrobacter sp. A20]|nr:hypothetical protein [Paenarthrobacter sp. A20]
MSGDIRFIYTGSDPLAPEWQHAAVDAKHEVREAILRSGNPNPPVARSLPNWRPYALHL